MPRLAALALSTLGLCAALFAQAPDEDRPLDDAVPPAATATPADSDLEDLFGDERRDTEPTSPVPDAPPTFLPGDREPPRPDAARHPDDFDEQRLNEVRPGGFPGHRESATAPRRAAAEPRVRNRYVLTSDEMTAERRIELRTGEASLRIVVKTQAAPGMPAESEEAAYKLAEGDDHISFWTTRNLRTGEVVVHNLVAPIDMQPGTTTLLEAIRRHGQRLRESEQEREAEFLGIVADQMQRLQQEQLTAMQAELQQRQLELARLSAALTEQQTAIGKLEAAIDARVDPHSAAPSNLPRFSIPQPITRRDERQPESIQPVDAREAQPDPASRNPRRAIDHPPADRGGFPPRPVTDTPISSDEQTQLLRSLQNEIRELRGVVEQLSGEVAELKGNTNGNPE